MQGTWEHAGQFHSAAMRLRLHLNRERHMYKCENLINISTPAATSNSLNKNRAHRSSGRLLRRYETSSSSLRSDVTRAQDRKAQWALGLEEGSWTHVMMPFEQTLMPLMPLELPQRDGLCVVEAVWYTGTEHT